MVELRWVTWYEDEPIKTDVIGYWVGKTMLTQKVKKKALQYRQKIDKTAYAGLNPWNGGMLQNLQWSEWCDVPEIEAEDE